MKALPETTASQNSAGQVQQIRSMRYEVRGEEKAEKVSQINLHMLINNLLFLSVIGLKQAIE